MFARCLLPALLLLAALDYCSAQLKPAVYPPVVTNKFAGSNKNVDKHLKKNFEIKGSQCYGVLHVREIPELKCGYGFGYTNLSLNVTVSDYKQVEIREPSPYGFIVVRERPCPKKLAVVEVDAGCGPVIP